MAGFFMESFFAGVLGFVLSIIVPMPTIWKGIEPEIPTAQTPKPIPTHIEHLNDEKRIPAYNSSSEKQMHHGVSVKAVEKSPVLEPNPEITPTPAPLREPKIPPPFVIDPPPIKDPPIVLDPPVDVQPKHENPKYLGPPVIIKKDPIIEIPPPRYTAEI